MPLNWEILSWTLEEKFHISAHPHIIIHFFKLEVRILPLFTQNENKTKSLFCMHGDLNIYRRFSYHLEIWVYATISFCLVQVWFTPWGMILNYSKITNQPDPWDHYTNGKSEMYPGFQIMGSSGPFLEKFEGPLLCSGGPANL